MRTRGEKSKPTNSSGGAERRKGKPVSASGRGLVGQGVLVCAGRAGGGGGRIRQSINFHTASTNRRVMIAPTSCRLQDCPKALLRQRIDSLGQRKIEIGQTAFAVGRKNE